MRVERREENRDEDDTGNGRSERSVSRTVELAKRRSRAAFEKDAKTKRGAYDHADPATQVSVADEPCALVVSAGKLGQERCTRYLVQTGEPRQDREECQPAKQGNEAERDLLHCLAVFAGPFSLDAACAVAAEVTSRAEIADGVAGLVGKSLVFRITDPAAVEFRLLEATRIYAMDRLAESGTLARVAHRHATHLPKLLGHLDNERRSKRPDEYLTEFRRCADEVHGALEWAFSSTGDPAIGLALTLAAEPLWFELFQLVAARGRLEQALSHADADSEVEMRLVSRWAVCFGTRPQRATPSSRRLLVRWRSPNVGRRLMCRPRHSGGFGRHAGAVAIIVPRSTSHIATRKPLRMRQTSEQYISETASLD